MKPFIQLTFVFCLGVLILSCQSSRNRMADATSTDTASITKPNPADLTKEDQSWTLYYISGPRISFEGLFPKQKPTLHFDMQNSRISGNAGCNQYGSQVSIGANNDSLSLIEPMMVTEMYCDESMQGETTYLNMLKKINRYMVKGDSLSLYMNEIEIMAFTRK